MDKLENSRETYIYGAHDAKTLAQLSDVASRAQKVALMADGHVGYIMPIGGVAAYDNKISVAGVGFDIACGNAAIKTDLKLGQLANLNELADEIAEQLSFGIGRKNQADDAPISDPLFEDAAWEIVPSEHREKLLNKARAQLGTVGSGNHYVDVFADETEQVWVGVHFGSRGFGHTIATSFMGLHQGKAWGEKVQEAETLLSLNDDLGKDYWAMMHLAGRYAYKGREWVARKVVSLMGAKEQGLIHNHHNFAWKETHTVKDHADKDYTDKEQGDKEFVVVRKGATPAFPGQKGFVGGSMGDNAVILQGRSNVSSQTKAAQENALYSTVHGAGRLMSRTEAAGKWDYKRKERKSKGLVSPEMMNDWLSEKGVILRGGGLDESPHAYRRLPDVLKAQGDTIEVLHTLRPLIVIMAGANEFDPYKD